MALPCCGFTAPGTQQPREDVKTKAMKGRKPGYENSENGEAKDPFSHLPPPERQILRDQVYLAESQTGYWTLFRYATKWDLVIMVISGSCAVVAGVALPMVAVLFGSITNTFRDFYVGSLTQAEFNHKLGSVVIYYVYLSIVEFFSSYAQTVGFLYTGDRLTTRIRTNYLAACLRQNMGFFDKTGSGEITTRITADTNLIQNGISDKLGTSLTAMATFVTALMIGFVSFWKLALIMIGGVLVIIGIMAICGVLITRYQKQALHVYAEGGTFVEETLGAIRAATAFNTQEKLARHYDSYLHAAQRWDQRAKLMVALNIGAMFSTIYLNYALAFWVGGRFVASAETTVGHVLTILMSTMTGAFALGSIAPNLQAFATASSAGLKIFSVIDRSPPVDSASASGHTLDDVRGEIEFRGIRHIYPSRPDVVVLPDFSLTVPAGKMTALVGASGSGKSTIVGLLERFYNPVRGQILLDGVDIAELNVGWLRRQIALVSQEPTLFGGTVYENIRLGLAGTELETADEEEVRRRIYDAATLANAHGFIVRLPEGYQTNVGERGFLLSGGQKQRIAIARALISNPRILLLDEPTSALDMKSEAAVSRALDAGAAGRTTIVIAHRLTTIKKADNIVLMDRGRIVEQGTHQRLLQNPESIYRRMFNAQRISRTARLRLSVFDDPFWLEQADDGKAELQLGVKVFASAVAPAVSDIQPPSPSYSIWSLGKMILAFNRRDWQLMVLGLGAAAMCGTGNPVQSVFFAKEVVSLAQPPSEAAAIRSDSRFWSLMYVLLAGTLFGAFCAQGLAFAVCSARLVRRVRDRAFRALLRQDLEYFDRADVGSLTSLLSTEATFVAGLSGATLGTILTVKTTLLAAIVVSCALGWKLALVCTATMPVLLACGFFRFEVLFKLHKRAAKAYESSAGYACEAIAAIETVASLTCENVILSQFQAQLDAQGRRSVRLYYRSAALYAFSQAAVLLVIGLGFWYGGTLIGKREYSLLHFFICFSAIIFGTQSAGSLFSFAPDMGKARAAAAVLRQLFDRVPSIDSWSTGGDRLPSVEGEIEFRDVQFAYATRPNRQVLRGLNLTIKPGQWVALVGSSGSGKSTVVSLLERFYDPQSGGIYVDGRDIRSLNVSNYRFFLTLVGQEPTIYSGSIRENILHGTMRTDVTEEEILTILQQANIHDFIMSLPDGLDTIVGSRGSMLSGGQKQRVAIARALIRDPRILLFDEATSALDPESEAAVQRALETAMKGRTTITVAHRLSTIRKADTIYVFHEGRVVETGTHQELMDLRGRYFDLVSSQD
ncbi:hypothetical protein MW887_008378 [Aspergillus wentii]|nr:hypothetical protein MW887_008378 [Aspergillus wentii]